MVTIMQNNVEFEDGAVDVGIKTFTGEFYTVGSKNVYEELQQTDP